MARLACPHAPLRTLIGRSSRDAVLHTGDDNDEFTERPERLRTLLTERQYVFMELERTATLCG
jgi:hypothetical protein